MDDSVARKVGGGAIVDVFSGLGIGLLVGLIVGMSVSPVVSIILGALVSLLAVFLGLQNEGSAEAESPKALSRVRANGVRIGSFGFACVAGIMLGVYIRAHQVFSAPIEQQVAKWTNAGYDPAEARKLVAFQQLGVKPTGVEIVQGELQKGGSSALFADLAEINLCNQLDPGRYADAQEVLRAYRAEDNAVLSTLADKIERLPAREQTIALQATGDALCELQSAEKRR